MQQLQGQSAAAQGRGRPAGAATVGQLAALALENGLVNRAADQLGRQRGGRPQAGRSCSVRHAVCPFPLQVSVLQTTLLLHPMHELVLTQLQISAERAVMEVPGRLGGGLPRPLLETPPLVCCRGRTCRRAARRLQHSCRPGATVLLPATGGHSDGWPEISGSQPNFLKTHYMLQLCLPIWPNHMRKKSCLPSCRPTHLTAHLDHLLFRQAQQRHQQLQRRLQVLQRRAGRARRCAVGLMPWRKRLQNMRSGNHIGAASECVQQYREAVQPSAPRTAPPRAAGRGGRLLSCCPGRLC
jgi:hypothetical protein